MAKIFFGLGQGSSLFGRWRLPSTQFNNFIVPVPSFLEQKAIVDFLDQKTTKIDNLIEKKQRQIELLHEERAVLINQAVTKGLNPSIPMRDSGIEWVGKIPKHWELDWLKHLFYFEKGKDAQKYTVEFVTRNVGFFPVYSGQTENYGVLGYINSYCYDTSPVILVTTVGAKAMSTQIINGKYSLSQNCAIIVPKKNNVDIRYFHFLMISMFPYEKNKISLIMQPSLRFSDLAQYRILFPPLQEQKEIADNIEKQTARIDNLVNKTQLQIELLREYRTTLIYETVVGKIDVRETI